jgi:hypothetical protein
MRAWEKGVPSPSSILDYFDFDSFDFLRLFQLPRVCACEGCGKRRHFRGTACKNADKRERIQARDRLLAIVRPEGVINSHQIAPVPRHRASLIYNALQKQHRGNRTMKAAGGVADSAFCDPRWGATALAGAVSRRTAEGWAAERYL